MPSPYAVLLLAVALSPSLAFADDEIAEGRAVKAPDAKRERKWTVVGGPAFEGAFAGLGLHLSVEGKLARKSGLAGSAGGALVALFPSHGGGSEFFGDVGAAGLLGISPRYYAIGSWDHGMQIGADLLGGAGRFAATPAFRPFVALVPFMGYKYTARGGFALELQAGLGGVASNVGTTPWVKANISLGRAF